ncbi:MAG: DNA-3-methyladenine glycosylase, partial [Actinobacteria bacterium]|nr:DNA-3-methyladenine glycosylase [Actinomycetota bacterium]
FRAAEPVDGIELMRKRRGGLGDDRLLASGPARLAQALGISREHNGTSVLRGGSVHLYEDDLTDRLRSGPVSQTTRIGLGVGKGDSLAWRWVVPGHPHASRRR